MSWNDFYRRRDIMDAVLRRARRDPEGPLPFAETPGAAEMFGSEQNFLLALHYKWTQLLSGHLRAEVTDDTDHVDAVSRAWQTAVKNHETLRAVLDAHLDRYPETRPVREAELRTLAVTAGLAEPNEAPEEVTKVGAAFEALLRSGDASRRSSLPVCQPGGRKPTFPTRPAARC